MARAQMVPRRGAAEEGREVETMSHLKTRTPVHPDMLRSVAESLERSRARVTHLEAALRELRDNHPGPVAVRAASALSLEPTVPVGGQLDGMRVHAEKCHGCTWEWCATARANYVEHWRWTLANGVLSNLKGNDYQALVRATMGRVSET